VKADKLLTELAPTHPPSGATVCRNEMRCILTQSVWDTKETGFSTSVIECSEQVRAEVELIPPLSVMLKLFKKLISVGNIKSLQLQYRRPIHRARPVFTNEALGIESWRYVYLSI